ncbi:MAG: hypothetical protein ABT12_01395 [Paludibacter sp. SCN 51-9]|nr:MAG: hypothetical protein ABS72_02470 [Paludibacter sp. SCN 50-10]ODU59330.1 MAG: hypothetical protein ABT12_01395 [Paludibacter sp. SCN 51-9]
MTGMKRKRMIRFTNALLAALLAVFGFSNCDEPRVEYGTPNADYTVRGKVVDKVNQQPVKGIRVSYSTSRPILMYGVIPTPYRPLATDTSQVDGTYKVSQRISAGELQNNMLPVYVEDIDGDENGLYRDTTIVVDFENAVRSGKKKGWYDGERTVELKVELQPKLKQDE